MERLPMNKVMGYKRHGELKQAGLSHLSRNYGLGAVVLICIVLIAATLGVYLQVRGHQFLTFDDTTYVVRNPHVASGMTLNNIIWAFVSTYASNWHPITWVSHIMDVWLYGMDPGGHHLTNVYIHTTSTLLLFILLLRLTGALWKSSLVALLFALHPLHVESVAWVAERKDVLSTFFCLISLLFYAQFTVKRNPGWYLFSFFSFVLGLMAKPMAVTLPVIMLLMDYWPLNRLGQSDDNVERIQIRENACFLLREKIPFWGASLLTGIATIYAQHTGGATRSLDAFPPMLRVENALTAYVSYLGKTLWPHDLGNFYPFPASISLYKVAGALLILILISVAAVHKSRRFPYLGMGWLWFLITLLPVIGLLQVGNQSMADRYSYLPTTGLFIIIAWGIDDLTRGMRNRKGILSCVAGVLIIALAAVTWRQIGYWKDNITLYRHTIDVTKDNYFMRVNLGAALADNGDVDGAIREYREAIRIDPKNPDVHFNLGNALMKQDLDSAILEFREALRLNPRYSPAHNNLGFALAEKGNPDAAIKEYREAIRFDQNFEDAHFNLGDALFSKDLAQAILEYRTTLRINPGNANAHNNLGFALAKSGETAEAIGEYREALRIDPGFTMAKNNLQNALARGEAQPVSKPSTRPAPR